MKMNTRVQAPSTGNSVFPKKTDKTTILVISSNPTGSSRLKLEKELRQIKEAIERSKCHHRFEVIPYPSARIKDIQTALLEHNKVFLHFCGHGSNAGIILTDENDNARLVKSEPLAALLQLFSKNIQCVFMNSCYSLAQCKTLSNRINKIICMKKNIQDDLAIHFSEIFYRSLGAGKSIDFSFKVAKNSIDLHRLKGSDVPVLLSKSRR